jgi:hypothetical protein
MRLGRRLLKRGQLAGQQVVRESLARAVLELEEEISSAPFELASGASCSVAMTARSVIRGMRATNAIRTERHQLARSPAVRARSSRITIP